MLCTNNWLLWRTQPPTSAKSFSMLKLKTSALYQQLAALKDPTSNICKIVPLAAPWSGYIWMFYDFLTASQFASELCVIISRMICIIWQRLEVIPQTKITWKNNKEDRKGVCKLFKFIWIQSLRSQPLISNSHVHHVQPYQSFCSLLFIGIEMDWTYSWS